MNETEIGELIEMVGALLEKHVSEERRLPIEKMLEDIGDLYFTAPASSKKQYHYAFSGGLAAHSINVLNNLVKLNNTFELGFNMESMVICSIFHDLGKAVNTEGNAHYVDSDQWQKDRYGQMFNKDNGLTYFPNHQRSMWILQKYGVKLSPEEYQAILLNDGMYLKENAAYSMKETELALFLHMADRIACLQESKEEQK